MKRTLALALLGMASATVAFGQGHVAIANYVSPYTAQILGPGGPLAGSTPIQFQVFFGEGQISDPNLLQPGITLGLDDTKDYLGGGWLLGTVQTLPTWAPGDTFTFQLRTLPGSLSGQAIDTAASRSPLWQELAAIQSTANPASPTANIVGLTVVVPEPSTFALAGLGAAALLIFRRRA
jgi:hypothetical protein